jgi:hypothetical protein
MLSLKTNAKAKEKPLWPLKIGISQSSSFAEFRGFRFHAGIDLRTKRKTGFPVYAIEDGFISRIKVQYRGYGYALYIDHPKLKRRVVYAHLQDFTGEPGEYVKQKLVKIKQRHGIDNFFAAERFPVKKGQVVGLSGESGAGPPHLHFEIRTLADEPVAPALSGYRPDDKITPRFHHIYFEPYSFPCIVNKSFLPYKGNLKKYKQGKYRFEKIALSGKAGIKIGVSDTNGAGNVYGVEKIEMLNGEKRIFDRLFHKYSYSQNHQCSLVFDYIKSNKRNTGYVVNMFKLPGETLPFSADYQTWDGLLSCENATSGFLQINAEDYGFNKISVSGKFEVSKLSYAKNIISSDNIDRCSFNELVTTPKYVVTLGTFASGGYKKFQPGLIEVRDSKNIVEALPVILRGKNAEIAVPFAERWEKGAWVDDRRIMPETVFVDADGKKVDMFEGGWVEFPKNSLMFPVYARFYKTNLKPTEGGTTRKGRLKPFSAVWKLEPEDVVFNGSVKIAIKPGDYQGDLQKLGLYKVTSSGRYSHVGETPKDGFLSASTRLGGFWVILEDLVSPALRYLRKGKDYHLGNVWVFKVSDVGEGVNYLSASATAAGKTVEVYSDPDKSEIYVVRPKLSRSVEVKLTIKDYAGNIGSIAKKLN